MRPRHAPACYSSASGPRNGTRRRRHRDGGRLIAEKGAGAGCDADAPAQGEVSWCVAERKRPHGSECRPLRAQRQSPRLLGPVPAPRVRPALVAPRHSGSARAGRRIWADTAARGQNRSPWRVLNRATPGHGSHRRVGKFLRCAVEAARLRCVVWSAPRPHLSSCRPVPAIRPTQGRSAWPPAPGWRGLPARVRLELAGSVGADEGCPFQQARSD
jgi:hypothetical protein